MTIVIIATYLVIGVIVYLLEPSEWTHEYDFNTGKMTPSPAFALATLLIWPMVILLLAGAALAALRGLVRRDQ